MTRKRICIFVWRADWGKGTGGGGGGNVWFEFTSVEFALAVDLRLSDNELPDRGPIARWLMVSSGHERGKERYRIPWCERKRFQEHRGNLLLLYQFSPSPCFQSSVPSEIPSDFNLDDDFKSVPLPCRISFHLARKPTLLRCFPTN